MSFFKSVFILSPHIDDAAFGLALTIAKCVSCQVPVTIINCFTVTKWTAVPVPNKSIEVVSQLRKDEDAVFYKSIGNIKIVNLDLLDAPLRNRYIFQHQPFVGNELFLIEQLTKLLRLHVDGTMLCPLAIGDHIDHAICRATVLNIYKETDVLFYEDLPYARRITFENIQNHIHELELQAGLGLNKYIVSTRNLPIDKGEVIRLYQSQMNEDIASEIIAQCHDVNGERLWGEEEKLSSFRSLISENN